MNPRSFAFAVKILGQNLTALRKHTAFQKLPEEAPKVAIEFLNLVAEEREGLEGKQNKIEDLE